MKMKQIKSHEGTGDVLSASDNPGSKEVVDHMSKIIIAFMGFSPSRASLNDHVCSYVPLSALHIMNIRPQRGLGKMNPFRLVK